MLSWKADYLTEPAKPGTSLDQRTSFVHVVNVKKLVLHCHTVCYNDKLCCQHHLIYYTFIYFTYFRGFVFSTFVLMVEHFICKYNTTKREALFETGLYHLNHTSPSQPLGRAGSRTAALRLFVDDLAVVCHQTRGWWCHLSWLYKRRFVLGCRAGRQSLCNRPQHCTVSACSVVKQIRDKQTKVYWWIFVCVSSSSSIGEVNEDDPRRGISWGWSVFSFWSRSPDRYSLYLPCFQPISWPDHGCG